MILHELVSYEVLRLIWWALMGVLLIGYAVTDGFDLGIGTLLPFVARTDIERRTVINTIGPIWEGNQVWLILGGGAIFAAWPQLYAVSFSGFYLAMFAILFAFILRPVAFKFRSKREDPAWRSRWDAVLFMAGLLPSIIFGVAVGNVLQGVPFRIGEDMQIFYEGTFLGLLNPFGLLCGLVSLAMLVMHGAAWLQLKTSGIVAERARRFGIGAAILTVVLYAVAGVVLAHLVNGYVITSNRWGLEPAAQDREHSARRLAGQLRSPPAAVGGSGPGHRRSAAGGAVPGRSPAAGCPADRGSGHCRHHRQRGGIDVPVHPPVVQHACGEPDGVGLVVEPPHAVHHAHFRGHLHAHHPDLHELGLHGAARQGGR